MINKKDTILAIDDEKDILIGLEEALKDHYNILLAENGQEALQLIKKNDISVALLDYIMPGDNGLQTLRKIKELDPSIEIIMVTAISNDPNLAFELAKCGAFNYILKPFDIADILMNICRASERRSLIKISEGLIAQIENKSFIGECAQIKKIKQIAKDVANHDTNVLIEGETGTGKEILAKIIHESGERSSKPFIVVNCGGLNSQFLESELFGHEKGAFTGALEKRTGKFELANNGTLFLDELGNMPLDIQGKLLRVLETKKIERLGGSKSISVDVRFISATNINLKEEIAKGNFREDLYYRLNTIPIKIPPLRERNQDIMLLFNHFLAYYNKKYRRSFSFISPIAEKALTNYNWPGNVRELKHIVERIVSLNNSKKLKTNHLPIEIMVSTENDFPSNKQNTLKKMLQNIENRIIESTLQECNNNQAKAAKKLGIAPSTISEKIKALKKYEK